MFLSIVAFLGCGKVMSHRSQIYFVLCQIWYKLQYYVSNMLQKLSNACSRLTSAGFMQRVGDFFSRIGEWFMGMVGQLRGRVSGRGGGRGGVRVDDDGSTMMQGLLMRENV
jgi:hypothetical protein